jgi:hypothetical protein
MGFWRIAKGVLTLGRSFDLEDAQAELEKLRRAYEEIRYGISNCNERLTSCVARLRREFEKTKRDLKLAHKIIVPPLTNVANPVPRLSPNSTSLQLAGKNANRQQSSLSTFSTGNAVFVGAGTGTAAAIAAWGAVQVIGVASTGAAIGGLSGAAATNAGWAAFGGGSLAAGGGGMAAGMFVLPGIGLAVGIATATFMTNRELKRVRVACKEVRGVNSQNGLLLSRLDAEAEMLEKAERRFVEAHDELAAEIRGARKELFRFGWFSQLWRLLRRFVNGKYYTRAEMNTVGKLEHSISEFMAEFSNR